MFVLSKGKPRTFTPIRKPNKLAGKSYTTKRPRAYDGHSIRHNTDRRLVYNSESTRGNIFGYVAGAGSERLGHVATFPEALAQDHILSWSNKDDIVLDPFLGSGTTLKMAVKNNRKCIGIEISEEYCELATIRYLRSLND